MKRSTPAFYLLSFLFLTLLIFIPKLGWSANIVWDGGAVADNNWSNPENWVGDVLPTSSDEVTFSGLSSNDSVNIDTNITVTGITINNSYSGTITQNSGSSITLNGSWVQDTGTFSGGDSDITITLNLNLSGGSFTATSTNLSLGGSLVYTAGTFSHNNGTVILTGNGCNMTLPDNSQSFYNLKINFASDGNNLYMYNASSVDITHLLTLTNGQLGSGTYKTPQFSHAATFDGGSATLTVNSGSETSTINSAGHMPKFILICSKGLF